MKLPKDANKKKVRISVDSSGIKVTGEGEWKVDLFSNNKETAQAAADPFFHVLNLYQPGGSSK